MQRFRALGWHVVTKTAWIAEQEVVRKRTFWVRTTRGAEAVIVTAE